jgi:Phage head-tail joining protein
MASTSAPASAGQRSKTVIAIEQLTETVGPTQFPVETWTPLYARVPAARRDETGAETFVAHQLSGAGFVRWTIEYLSACDPERGIDVVKQRRIVAEGRVYDILEAAQIGYRVQLEFRTRAKVG